MLNLKLNPKLKLGLISRNPVSSNDNVDDALNIIEIEVVLVSENIHFSLVLYIFV